MTTHGTARTRATARGRTACTDRQGAWTFTAYVQARGPVLLRAARSLTADPRDAEDLLQTALAKTYLAWHRIEDHRALDGYVRKTLLNTRTSLWRKRRIAEFVHEEPPEPDHGRRPCEPPVPVRSTAGGGSPAHPGGGREGVRHSPSSAL